MKPFISNSDIKKKCFKRIFWCPEKLAKTFADVTLCSLSSERHGCLSLKQYKLII